MPIEKVRASSASMGGNFGNKNQNQDADLHCRRCSPSEAGAPVKLELSRKEDFIGVHGRWPTTQHYKVGVKADGTLTSIQLRGISGMGPYRKNSGAIGGIEVYQCPEHRDRRHSRSTPTGRFRETSAAPNSRRGSSASSR